MAARNYSNIAVDTTLASGIGADDASMTVAAATGWPAAPFTLVIEPGEANEEIVLVGSKTGTLFSGLTRGYNGSTGKTHVTGSVVKHVAIATDFTELFTHNHEGDYTQLHHGALAGLSDPDHQGVYILAIAGSPVYQNIPIIGESGDQMEDSGYAMDDLAAASHNHSGVYALAGHGHIITDCLPLFVPGTLATGTGVGIRYRITHAGVITGVRSGCAVAPTGASIIADVHKNGTTIFTTQAERPTIAVDATDSGSWHVPDVTAVAVDDLITLDVDQVGSSTPGTDLTVWLKYYRTL